MATKPSNQAMQPNPVTTEPRPRLKTVANNMGLTQAYELRNVTASEALALADAPYGETETRSSRAQAICALVRAWGEATQAIRILRGKPLPGSLRPEKKQPKKKQSRATPSEHPSEPTT